MQISNTTKKISLALFALFLAFSFFNTSFAHTLLDPHTHCAGTPPYWVKLGIKCDNGPAIDTTNPNVNPPPVEFENPNYADTFVPLTPSQTNKDTDTTYTWLERLPGFDESFVSTKKCAFVDYLNIMIKLLIGIGAVLAMVMIVMGGMEYMTSELISSKEAGKSRIMNAMLGLVIALSSYLILNTINPNLLNLCLDKQLPRAEITITEETGEDTIGVAGKTVTVNGQTLTACNESEYTTISFLGKQVKVNKAIVSDLQAINTEWQNSTDPAIKNYSISTIYGQLCKHVKNQPNQTSGHAFGIALDINPVQNPFSYTSCTTNMPQPAFVKMFTSRGFGWGGNWTSKKDPMHFSKLPGETGSGSCP